MMRLIIEADTREELEAALRALVKPERPAVQSALGVYSPLAEMQGRQSGQYNPTLAIQQLQGQQWPSDPIISAPQQCLQYPSPQNTMPPAEPVDPQRSLINYGLHSHRSGPCNFWNGKEWIAPPNGPKTAGAK